MGREFLSALQTSTPWFNTWLNSCVKATEVSGYVKPKPCRLPCGVRLIHLMLWLLGTWCCSRAWMVQLLSDVWPRLGPSAPASVSETEHLCAELMFISRVLGGPCPSWLCDEGDLSVRPLTREILCWNTTLRPRTSQIASAEHSQAFISCYWLLLCCFHLLRQ